MMQTKNWEAARILELGSEDALRSIRGTTDHADGTDGRKKSLAAT
jgi:hypothetical protein